MKRNMENKITSESQTQIGKKRQKKYKITLRRNMEQIE